MQFKDSTSQIAFKKGNNLLESVEYKAADNFSYDFI